MSHVHWLLSLSFSLSLKLFNDQHLCGKHLEGVHPLRQAAWDEVEQFEEIFCKPSVAATPVYSISEHLKGKYALGIKLTKCRSRPCNLASSDHLCSITPMRTPRILPSELTAAILWPCSREVLYSYIIEPLDKSTPTDLVRNCKTICIICICDDNFLYDLYS